MVGDRASHCKVHPHATGDSQGIGRTKGGLNTKIHLAVDTHDMPLRVLVMEGIRADCTEAVALTEGMEVEHLYRHRHLVENTFLYIKQCRALCLVVS